MRLYQRAKWPDDTAEIIKRMRGDGKAWAVIAAEFGVTTQTVCRKAQDLGAHVGKTIKRFTPEEDAYIRQEWAKNTPVEQIAQALSRSEGVVRQRILHKLRDLVGTRSALGTRLVNRYGHEVLGAGGTPEEIHARLKEIQEQATAKARASAHAKWLAKQRMAINAMHEAIAAGTPRNMAIAECRSAGVTLERLGEEFGITRERVRQICGAEVVRQVLVAEPKLKAV